MSIRREITLTLAAMLIPTALVTAIALIFDWSQGALGTAIIVTALGALAAADHQLRRPNRAPQITPKPPGHTGL